MPQSAPLPPDDTARLAALAELALREAPIDPVYEAVARLAAAICLAPMHWSAWSTATASGSPTRSVAKQATRHASAASAPG